MRVFSWLFRRHTTCPVGRPLTASDAAQIVTDSAPRLAREAMVKRLEKARHDEDKLTNVLAAIRAAAEAGGYKKCFYYDEFCCHESEFIKTRLEALGYKAEPFINTYRVPGVIPAYTVSWEPGE